MSYELGYIRVVNIKGDKDHRPAPDETLVMMDRTNKVLGNPHFMCTHSRLERERGTEAYRKDLEADFAANGPMRQALLAVARDIVDNGTKVAAGCWCSLPHAMGMRWLRRFAIWFRSCAKMPPSRVALTPRPGPHRSLNAAARRRSLIHQAAPTELGGHPPGRRPRPALTVT